jgi:hypothetical protein
MDRILTIKTTGMKQYPFMCFILIFLFLLTLSSCKKEKLTKMKKGKYEMVNIRTFTNGQKDTIHCMVYGPRIMDHHYYFSPEISETVVDEIDVHISRRRMLVKGIFRRVESWSVRFYSDNLSPPGYFAGSVDSYDLQENKLVINYTSTATSYGIPQEEGAYTGSVQFKWVEL